MNGKINGLNLGSDVMHLKMTEKNIVSKHKRFNDMKIRYLYAKYMQKIDLGYVLNYSLRKNKTFYIEHDKSLKYANIYNLK